MTSVRAVRVHCPVSAAGLARLQAGDGGAIAGEPALAAIVAIIRDSEVLGVLPGYRGVIELGFGLETFIPGPGAVPTTGAVGQPEVVPCVTVKTYAAIGAEIEAPIDAILAVHPWEVPVIEISEVELGGLR